MNHGQTIYKNRIVGCLGGSTGYASNFCSQLRSWSKGHKFKPCSGLHPGCEVYLKKKRTLTPSLQPAQGTKSLSTTNHPGSQPALNQTWRKPDCYLKWQSRKLNNYFFSNQPIMIRIWLINNTAFLIFISVFQLCTNQRKSNVYPLPII